MPSFLPPPPPLSFPASQFVVVRYHRDASGDDRFEVMPNLVCHSYHFQEGPVVPSAQFSYILNDIDPSTAYPYLLEELWGLSVSGPYVVRAGDELVVYEFDAAGARHLVFDGFAELPQADHSGRGLAVSFTAASVHKRLWDSPVAGATYRDADAPASGGPVPTGLPTWFNPNEGHNGESRPNKTPDGHDHHDGLDDQRPLFLDWRLPAGVTDSPDFWTLSDLVYYLMWEYNPGEKYAVNPVSFTLDPLADYLQTAVPKSGSGSGYMDLSDPDTYDLKPVTVRAHDATGEPWIETVAGQCKYYGFSMFFNTLEDEADPGAPRNEVILYRADGRDAVRPKELFYPANGASLAEGLPDFDGLSLARDHFEAANEWAVETAPVEYEVSLVLAPGFEVAGADAANVAQFDRSQLANAAAGQRKKYRYFVFDEAGLGHWDGASFVTGTPTSLDAVLGAPDPDTGVRPYARRLRPGRPEVLAIDSAGNPRRAELAISRTYSGPKPGVWDRSATDWQSFGQSGWRLDEDSLSVWVTADNPENWSVPKATGVGTATGGVVRAVTSLAAPAGPDSGFTLRLTTVVAADSGIDATAKRRDASPVGFTVKRRVEARDHWRKQVADKSSVYNTTGGDYTVRDDTDRARAHADALRLDHEFPAVAGSVTTPGVAHGLGVGDLVSKVSGREVDLLQNAGGPAGEGPRYPAVVGFSVSTMEPQRTTFKFSDRRAEPESAAHGFTRGGPGR